MRRSLPFDIDGAVVKVNDFAMRNEIGFTTKVPKWAVAFKYPPEEKETTLNEIEINVGRTGALTPVAVFDPVQLAGAVLHSERLPDMRCGSHTRRGRSCYPLPEYRLSGAACKVDRAFREPQCDEH